MNKQQPIRLQHPRWGECQFVSFASTPLGNKSCESKWDKVRGPHIPIQNSRRAAHTRASPGILP